MTTENRGATNIGMVDLRPQITAVEGRRIDLADPRLTSPAPLSLEELTRDSMERVRREWLDQNKVERAQKIISILDYLDSTEVANRRKVFALVLWDELDDSREVNQFLGVSRATNLDAYIGEAMDYPDVVRASGHVKFLMRPLHFEVLKMKREGSPHKKIEKDTELPMGDIELISRRLILARLYQPGPSSRRRTDEYREFCDLIIRLRESGLANFEIAQQLVIRRSRVAKAVMDLIAIGEVNAIDPNDAKMKLPKHQDRLGLKAAIKELRAQGLQVPEIAVRLGISNEDVGSILYRTPEMPRHRQTRREQKKILRGILNDHMRIHPGERISLNSIRSSEDLVISDGRLVTLYDQIASEQEVPPRKVLGSRAKK